MTIEFSQKNVEEVHSIFLGMKKWALLLCIIKFCGSALRLVDLSIWHLMFNLGPIQCPYCTRLFGMTKDNRVYILRKAEQADCRFMR